ncbi:uncharacterized protein BJ212DRAFT_1574624 [Suillus subaureus]|uniref:Uncharacterized protein n=1 Tax=Suillus subaureus TaxID=48587 RepID=A0A9P7EJ63_9AGAM|nr:uncharacterized protein BJ212DRAFT_1574624 [Suillus subaureus]KAG1822692.1 hypothetical protein BJ212DRAFT_1574624 [Suillus subaureus]
MSFGSTGAGVMPAKGTQANNLLDAALLELPWYMDLDSICMVGLVPPHALVLLLNPNGHLVLPHILSYPTIWTHVPSYSHAFQAYIWTPLHIQLIPRSPSTVCSTPQQDQLHSGFTPELQTIGSPLLA